jgi:hypothetical protein
MRALCTLFPGIFSSSDIRKQPGFWFSLRPSATSAVKGFGCGYVALCPCCGAGFFAFLFKMFRKMFLG